MESLNYSFEKLKKLSKVSGVHGLKSIAKSEILILKICWIALIMACVAISIYFMVINIQNYEKYETNIKMTIKNDYKPVFPAVTICNANPFNNNTDTIQYIINAIFDIYNDTLGGYILNFLGLDPNSSFVPNTTFTTKSTTTQTTLLNKANQTNVTSFFIYYSNTSSWLSINNFEDIYSSSPIKRIVLIINYKVDIQTLLSNNLSNLTSPYFNYTYATPYNITTAMENFTSSYAAGVLFSNHDLNALQNTPELWSTLTSSAKLINSSYFSSLYDIFLSTQTNLTAIVSKIASYYTNTIVLTIDPTADYQAILQNLLNYINSYLTNGTLSVVKKRSIELKSSINENKDIVGLIKSVFKTNNTNVILSEILDTVRSKVIADRSLDSGRRYFLGQFLNDLIISFSFNNKNIETNKEVLKQYWNYKYGNCYTFHPENITTNYLNKNSVEYVFEINAGKQRDVGRFLETNGIHLFIHDKDKDSNLIEGGVDLPTGISTQIDVTKKVFNMLDKPYSSCIDSLTSFSKVNYQIFGYMFALNLTEYNQALCYKLCFQEQLLSKCGCLDYSIPIIKNGSFCFKLNDVQCLKDFQNYFTTSNLNDLCKPICPQQCHTTTYTINKHIIKYPTDSYAKYLKSLVPDAYNESVSSMKKYLEKTVLMLVIRYKYSSYESFDSIPNEDVFDIISKVGQFWNLFLGVSLISAIEILEFMISLVIRFVKQIFNPY